jgi:hypothetical protein
MDYHDLYYEIAERLPKSFEFGVQHNDEHAWTLVNLWKQKVFSDAEQKQFFETVKKIAGDLYVVGLEDSVCFCIIVADSKKKLYFCACIMRHSVPIKVLIGS